MDQGRGSIHREKNLFLVDQILVPYSVRTKVCTLKNNTNLNSIFCLIKSSEIVVILLQTFYQLCDSHDITIFEEIAILKKRWRHHL